VPLTLKRILIGKAKDPLDPKVFHNVTLVAFLAWVGLGADGLSSSAYGPEEAFRALGPHVALAVVIALMIAVTVLVISACYSRVIELFPGGGGGYLVATKLLGPKIGVISGCALIVDYVLTISTSVASGVDQVFSLFPASWAGLRLDAKFVILAALTLLNLRGVKESVQVLVPVFLLFVGTHALMIVASLIERGPLLPSIYSSAVIDARVTTGRIGLLGTMLVLLRAYSLGGGAYTGIEAVSNGVQILREPKVANAKRTMRYMAFSLAFTAGGIMLAYLLTGARPHPTKVMNAVLAENVFGAWKPAGFPLGAGLIVATLVSAGAILVVAAQTGFLDGPRVLANMAVDSWAPRRFAQLSDRLVTNNGIVLMGGAAAVTLWYTGGRVAVLLVMYAINVFVTFSLTLLGMSRYWTTRRHADPKWIRGLALHGFGFLLCFAILSVTVYEKLEEGGWITLLATSALVALAFSIRRHYAKVRDHLRRLDEQLLDVPVRPHPEPAAPIDRNEPVAVMLVNGYSGLGVHTVLSVQSLFPKQYGSYLFLSVGVIDSAVFKGEAEIDALQEHTEEDLRKYVDYAHKLGFKADYRYSIGTEAVQSVVELCEQVRSEFPRSIFYLGQLVFQNARLVNRILHNETAFSIQRRLQFAGLQAVVLPIRVLEPRPRANTA
jgi:hypothetical protein